ncbi:MAG TPA: SDR family oxidoreductase, partial [Dongiaceae bacterium]
VKPGKLFCFGLGFSALHLARRLRSEGWTVAGTCRSEEKRQALLAEGIAAHLFDRQQTLGDAAAALHGVTHIVSSIPPDQAGDPVLDLHLRELQNLESLRWICYLSTTGVYGDRGGDWVDEDSPRNPTLDRSRRRALAEDGWLTLWERDGLPVHIFRLAGIYGPGRSAIDSVRSGAAKRIVKPGQVFSRIHVDDIASVLIASMTQPNPGAAYNVCDDNPAPPDEVIAYAAELLGIEPPPVMSFEKAELSEMARSFYADNKRVRNNRIKNELGVSLRYPDYRAGLQAILAGSD